VVSLPKGIWELWAGVSCEALSPGVSSRLFGDLSVVLSPPGGVVSRDFTFQVIEVLVVIGWVWSWLALS